MSDLVEIPLNRLRPGVYISLDMPWMDHTFLFNQFVITSEKQLQELKSLGLKAVKYSPSRSRVQPLGPTEPAPAPAAPSAPDTVSMPAIEAKLKRMEKLNEFRDRTIACEKSYTQAAGSVKNVMRNLQSPFATREAATLVNDMVDAFFDADIMIHLLSDRKYDPALQFHSLNVLVLSMMVAREVGLSQDEMRTLGMGALFHDVGKTKIPDHVVRNPQRNRHEEDMYRLHPEYGASMMESNPHFPRAALPILSEHHEACDGTGYPRGVKTESINLLSRIVAIADQYDLLCNMPKVEDSLTPAEAVAKMFRYESSKLDSKLLQIFIKQVGIYPPGSIIELSNGNVGLVLGIDAGNLLRPTILIYDNVVPRNQAILINLAETPELKVERSVRPSVLPPDVLHYLNPRQRVLYFYSKPGG